jgi:hypothetical protein
MTTKDNLIAEIARRHLLIDTLETRETLIYSRQPDGSQRILRKYAESGQ